MKKRVNELTDDQILKIREYIDQHFTVEGDLRRENSMSIKRLIDLFDYDLILITTDHAKFDYSLIQKNAKLIIDTRGVYLNQFRNVVKA